MKKLAVFLFTLNLAFVSFGLSTSSAEEIILPSAEGSSSYELLCDGEIVHFLQIISSPVANANASAVTFSAACYAVNENNHVAVCTEHCGEIFSQIPPFEQISSFGKPYFVIRSPQNHTYLITMSGEVYQWRTENHSDWNQITTLDLQGIDTSLTFEADIRDFIFFAYAIDEDTFYASYKNDGDGYTIYAFDLKNGNRRQVCYVGQIYSLSAGGNQLLACASENTTGSLCYYLIDTATGKKTKLAMGLGDYQASELIYDGQSGWYYASTSGTIRHLNRNGEESVAASLPMASNDSWYQLARSADGSTLLLLEKSSDGVVIFRTMGVQSEKSSQLTFSGWTSALNQGFETLPSFGEFAAEHGQVKLITQEDLHTGHDVAQALLTENDTFDILMMPISQMDLTSLYSKGFFVDLTEDDAIKAYFDQLYPAWRDACMWEGKIAAFPLQADDHYQFMYNTDLWEELGLTVPATYDQLFQSIQQWSEEGILEEYPLFQINGKNRRSFEHLFNKLMGDYILQCEIDQQPLNFQDSTLLELLSQLEAMRTMLDEHDALNLMATPLMTFTGGITAVSRVQVYESIGHFQPLMLAFSPEKEPIMQADLIVMIVNPRGANAELAREYLAYIAANPTAATQCLFLQGMPEGIATEKSLKARAEWEAEYATCLKQLEEIKQTGDEKAITAAQDALSNLTTAEVQVKWLVTPEHARTLYQALPYTQVLPYDPYTVVMDNGDQAMQRFLSGQIGTKELLNNLRSLVLMIEAE